MKIFTVLNQWLKIGWLRNIDVQFAQFIKLRSIAMGNICDEAVILAAALVSHQLSIGHICLNLKNVLNNPNKTLDFYPYVVNICPPSTLFNYLSLNKITHWKIRLKNSQLVTSIDNLNINDSIFLKNAITMILDGNRLYIRRLWHIEGIIAQNLIKFLIQHYNEVDHNILNYLLEIYESLQKYKTCKINLKIKNNYKLLKLLIQQKLIIISVNTIQGTKSLMTCFLVLIQEYVYAINIYNFKIIITTPPIGKYLKIIYEAINMFKKLTNHIIKYINIELSTLHSIMDKIIIDTLLSVDIIFIYEASMINLDIMQTILENIPKTARIILIIDKDQLYSFDTGAILNDIIYKNKIINYNVFFNLDKKIYCFNENSGIFALSNAINSGNTKKISDCWTHGYKDIAFFSLEPNILAYKIFIKHAVNGYLEYFKLIAQCSDPTKVIKAFSNFKILCAFNFGHLGVYKINKAIAFALYSEKLIINPHGWFPGRPVIVTRPNHKLGLYNGDIGIFMFDKKSNSLRVFFDTHIGIRSFTTKSLHYIETVFAMTIYKSQFSYFNSVLIVLQDNPIINRHLVYTGVTRAKHFCEIVASSKLVIEKAAKNCVYRESNVIGRLIRYLPPLIHSL
ncbi:Exodeoxyribonuclease V alpha chain [Candidatus Johnevansia muelleri]|uniref:Exodeoxyribonuclease V alpha chain n=1 Tax=Candidatus Johnevansia muelleri TaxID=1495769 RepID=A0A078KEL2_9GAMM|nr:Exodeoxyribonuclease V alpha chain [Candidatus Evansia muelleri]